MGTLPVRGTRLPAEGWQASSILIVTCLSISQSLDEYQNWEFLKCSNIRLYLWQEKYKKIKYETFIHQTFARFFLEFWISFGHFWPFLATFNIGFIFFVRKIQEK